ncbi:hypothetical protein ACFE04_017705 [Oxalis oulophora]
MDNFYDDSPSLREIFKHEFNNYSPTRTCRCRFEAHMMTAKTDSNPGRRFYTCAAGTCRYFAWHDCEFPARCVEIINKCRVKLVGLQYAERLVNELQSSINFCGRMLKISIFVNVVLMVALAFLIGRM